MPSNGTILRTIQLLPKEITAQPWHSAAGDGRRSRWIFWAVRGSSALLDQGLISGSNFVVGVLLARWLSPSQYGGYALAFAIFLLLSLSYQALLLEPQRIFGPADYGDQQREYLGVLLWFHSVFALIICFCLGASATLMRLLGNPDGVSGALTGITLAAPCMLLLWLARGGFYVTMSPQQAAKGAAVYCAVALVSLAVIERLGMLSSFLAFVVMGLAACIGSVVLLVKLKPILSLSTGRPNWNEVFQRHWRYGRWLLLSSVLSWLTGDIYYPLVSGFSGIEAAGELKALLNFSLPPAQVFSALSIFVLPYASRVQHERGASGLKRLTYLMAVLYVAGAVIYWVPLMLSSESLVHLLYGGRYSHIASLMPWVAAASVPWSVAYVPTIALRATRSSASLFGIYCTSSVVAVVVGVPMTWAFGLQGALCTMVVSNVSGLIVAYTFVIRKMRHLPIT